MKAFVHLDSPLAVERQPSWPTNYRQIRTRKAAHDSIGGSKVLPLQRRIQILLRCIVKALEHRIKTLRPAYFLHRRVEKNYTEMGSPAT